MDLPQYAFQQGRPCWFVDAAQGGPDQTEAYLRDGNWILSPSDDSAVLFAFIEPGDRIALVTTSWRSTNLPFDSRGQDVPSMILRARGTVRTLSKEGKLDVDWTVDNSGREWYFYTPDENIWRIYPGMWADDALIAFAFNGSAQDIERFRTDPVWGTRSKPKVKNPLAWIPFYQVFADKLLTWQDRRAELAHGLHTILVDRGCCKEGGSPSKNICPFTVLGVFNQGRHDAKRTAIATDLAHFLDVKERVPDDFAYLLTGGEQSAWSLYSAGRRRTRDLDCLWDVFAQAIRFADAHTQQNRIAFQKAYDAALSVYNVKWSLSLSLHWIRPWFYLCLDKPTREYIATENLLKSGRHLPKRCCNANAYLDIRDELERIFQRHDCPFCSFPELTLQANQRAYVRRTVGQVAASKSLYFPLPIKIPEQPAQTQSRDNAQQYTLQTILDQGCFLEKEQLELMLKRLRAKKNLILQGPPGTGKTWLARKLAYALIGQRDSSRIRAVPCSSILRSPTRTLCAAGGLRVTRD